MDGSVRKRCDHPMEFTQGYNISINVIFFFFKLFFYMFFLSFLLFSKTAKRVEKENSSMALRFLPALTMMRLSSRPVMRVQVRLETCVASL